MKLALLVSTLLIGSMSHAAIAMNYDCTDGLGTNISWEVRPGSDMDKYDRLHGGINISVNDVTKSTEDGKYVVGKDASITATNFDTGDSVAVNASKLVKDDGDERTFSGKADIVLKIKELEIRRSVNVTCTAHGEA